MCNIYSLAKGDKRRPICLLYRLASVALFKNNFETFWHRKKRSTHLGYKVEGIIFALTSQRTRLYKVA